MASTYTALGVELMATGENAGTWGTKTNTNLQINEQTSTGVLEVDLSAGSSTLVLTDGATSTGKNIYYRLYGTLAANRTITMPGTAKRVWVMKDDTVRGTSNRTLGVLTASGTEQPIPPGATVLCKSNGSETVVTILEKGYASITNSNSPYTAVAGAQILANTTTSTITVTLPSAASTGDEVTITDSYGTFQSNNLTVDRNGLKINGGTSNLTLSNNGQSLTLVYVDATRGWVYKTNYTS